MSEFTDTELLDRLETILRKSGQIIEVWLDDAGIMWADDECADSLRQALTKLVTDV